MKCCTSCFKDDIINSEIYHNGELGNCDFCSSEDVQTIDPKFLHNYFAVLFSIYKPADDSVGEKIHKLINDDWNIISDKVDNQLHLLSNILDPDVTSSKYEKPEIDMDHIQTWSEFRNEIVNKNRFFPSAVPYKDKLIKLFSYLTIDLFPPVKYYRCRIQNSDIAYESSEMGKPPADKVKNGRVNPIGISYLYLASEKDIAIHEVRPHIGHRVTIASFQLVDRVSVIDLRNPEATLSPFTFEEDDLLSLYTDLNYIKMLSSELSSPVIPDKTDTGYLPSQYLCEIIKIAGFGGVVYNSSMASIDGYNLALFDDKKIEIIDKPESIKINSNLLQWVSI